MKCEACNGRGLMASKNKKTGTVYFARCEFCGGDGVVEIIPAGQPLAWSDAALIVRDSPRMYGLYAMAHWKTLTGKERSKAIKLRKKLKSNGHDPQETAAHLAYHLHLLEKEKANGKP